MKAYVRTEDGSIVSGEPVSAPHFHDNTGQKNHLSFEKHREVHEAGGILHYEDEEGIIPGSWGPLPPTFAEAVNLAGEALMSVKSDLGDADEEELILDALMLLIYTKLPADDGVKINKALQALRDAGAKAKRSVVLRAAFMEPVL